VVKRTSADERGRRKAERALHKRWEREHDRQRRLAKRPKGPPPPKPGTPGAGNGSA
jgi:hypothetical protein